MRRRRTIGSKLEQLINVRCEVIVNFRSKLQEYIACQVDDLGDVIQRNKTGY